MYVFVKINLIFSSFVYTIERYTDALKKVERYGCTMDKSSLIFEELNPTFMYAWKVLGSRNENFHSHDFLQLVVVLSGAGKYKVNETIYPIKEGDVLVINPTEGHTSMPAESDEMPTREMIIGFCDIQIQGYEKNYLPLVKNGHVIHTTGDVRQKILKICAAMEAENTIDKQGRYYMMKAYLMQLLIILLREQEEPLENYQGYSFETINKKYVVEQILGYFEDHYSEKVSLDRIAENMYLSPFYISKIFKSETGDTPIRHLINIRLEKAREILRKEKDRSIQEVAACVGYDDAYHFSKLYKKHFGVSPSQTRRSAE